jgi:aerobic-type carbon monoxide dehydrogenase small subunit (CoxS/CutS family)
MPPEVTLRIDGVSLVTEAGISVAAALARAGLGAPRQSVSGTARGAFCGMGVCFECRVLVDGVERLACLTPVAADMEISIG